MIICFSGLDGCGKGTQKELLAKRLRRRGRRVFMSKAYGEAEKECFSAFVSQWSQESILFLFQALHAEQRLQAEAALARGEIVIADRWDESYLAYHAAHGILARNPDLREALNGIAFSGILPDLAFFLDLPVDAAKQRIESRGSDFFDRLPAVYHRTMRNEYLRIARERGWHILDGARSVEKIHADVMELVSKHISLR